MGSAGPAVGLVGGRHDLALAEAPLAALLDEMVVLAALGQDPRRGARRVDEDLGEDDLRRRGVAVHDDQRVVQQDVESSMPRIY